MKVKVITSAVLLALMVSQPATAVDAPQSPLMKQLNNGNWLPQEEAQSLSDELYYQDAIQAYIQTLPLLNTIGLRDGSEAAFGKGYNVLPIWKERMDSRAVVPTPNGDVIYSMSYLDLKETGPLVIKAPPNVIGMLPTSSRKPLPMWALLVRIVLVAGCTCYCPRTTTGRCLRGTTRLNPRPTMCSCSSEPLWAKVTGSLIRFRR